MYVDRCMRNSYIANVCGITLSELNMLELTTFHLLRYHLFISEEKYASYVCVSDGYLNTNMNRPVQVPAPESDIPIAKNSVYVVQ